MLVEPSDRPECPAEDDPLLETLALRGAIRALAVEDRRLLVGRYWQDLSYDELADALDMPASTVGVRLHRIRLGLKRALVKL